MLAAEAGDHAACQLALQAIPESAPLAGTATVWSWTYTVPDPTKLPAAFQRIVADDTALGDLCTAFKDKDVPPTVDGVVFARVARVQPRGRTK